MFASLSLKLCTPTSCSKKARETYVSGHFPLTHFLSPPFSEFTDTASETNIHHVREKIKLASGHDHHDHNGQASSSSAASSSDQPTEACRITGEVKLNKVAGMLHFTAAGHGYWGQHTPHESKMKPEWAIIIHGISELNNPIQKSTLLIESTHFLLGNTIQVLSILLITAMNLPVTVRKNKKKTFIVCFK